LVAFVQMRRANLHHAALLYCNGLLNCCRHKHSIAELFGQNP
jgi:hypothetical protein